MDVLGIAEARATLPSLIDRLASGDIRRVFIGSHCKPEAMIVPFDGDHTEPELREALLAKVVARADLVRRIGSTSGIIAVAVFGSVARSEERADSDIDLLVDVAPGTNLFDLARFEIDMELLFDRNVHVIARGGLKDTVRDRAILNDALVL